MHTSTWSFLLTSLVIVATPGIGTVYTLNAGLLRGRRAAVWAAAACTAGIVPHLLAAVGGLAAVLQTNDVLFGALLWAGIAYLLYMAHGTWRDPGTAWSHLAETGRTQEPRPGGASSSDGLEAALRVEAGTSLTGTTRRKVLRDGVVLNLLNPKLTLFFLAFLPQFATTRDPVRAAVEMSGLGALFMLMTFVVFTAYGAGAAGLRPLLIRRPTVLAGANKVFAGLYLLLAVGLAVQQVR